MATSNDIVRTYLPDEIIEDKNCKDPNTTTIKRIVLLRDTGDDSEKVQTSIIKRTKVLKEGTKGIKERSEFAKFGLCEGQNRGIIESGIVRVDNDIKIINRKQAQFQESLLSKLKNNSNNITKEVLMEKMINEQEKERKNMIDMMNQNTYQNDKKKLKPRACKDTDIKVTGFDMRCEEKDLMEIFEKVGRVRRCTILRDRIDRTKKKNVAYIEFESTMHVEEAIREYDNKTVGLSVLNVCRPNEIN